MYRNVETYNLNKKKHVTIWSFVSIVSLLIILGAIKWFVQDPYRVEMIYSRKLFPVISYILSRVQFFTTISVGEIIILGLIIGILVKLIMMIIKRKKSEKSFLRILIKLIIIILSVVVFFQLAWGMNYHRQSLEMNFGFDERSASLDELKDINRSLVSKAKNLRTNLTTDENDVTYYPAGLDKIYEIVGEGYKPLNKAYPWIRVPYTQPKKLLSSRFYTYSGISGVYNPFTSESNVNVDGTHHFKPFTAAHEMAHQIGIAAENEANFIAYLVCVHHEDDFIQYSGYLGGIVYTLRAIHKSDPNGYAEFYQTLDEDVMRDISAHSAFWRSYEGIIEEIGDKVNDTYLKANSQSDGVISYGKMVDLLIAWYDEHDIN